MSTTTTSCYLSQPLFHLLIFWGVGFELLYCGFLRTLMLPEICIFSFDGKISVNWSLCENFLFKMFVWEKKMVSLSAAWLHQEHWWQARTWTTEPEQRDGRIQNNLRTRWWTLSPRDQEFTAQLIIAGELLISHEPKGSHERINSRRKQKAGKEEQKWRHRHRSLCTHNGQPVTYNGLHSYASKNSAQQCCFNH